MFLLLIYRIIHHAVSQSTADATRPHPGLILGVHGAASRSKYWKILEPVSELSLGIVAYVCESEELLPFYARVLNISIAKKDRIFGPLHAQ